MAQRQEMRRQDVGDPFTDVIDPEPAIEGLSVDRQVRVGLECLVPNILLWTSALIGNIAPVQRTDDHLADRVCTVQVLLIRNGSEAYEQLIYRLRLLHGVGA